MDRAQSPAVTGNNTAAAAAAAASEKARLTEEEKKSNHIASEQKRRQAIREGFDEMAEIVPGMSGQGRSEALVLERASAYLKDMLATRWELVSQARQRGIDVKRFELDHETMRIAEEAYTEQPQTDDSGSR